MLSSQFSGHHRLQLLAIIIAICSIAVQWTVVGLPQRAPGSVIFPSELDETKNETSQFSSLPVMPKRQPTSAVTPKNSSDNNIIFPDDHAISDIATTTVNNISNITTSTNETSDGVDFKIFPNCVKLGCPIEGYICDHDSLSCREPLEV